MSTPARAVRLAALSVLTGSAALLVALPDLLVRAVELQNRWEGRAAAPVVCSFRARTGHACLGCGGTRALRLASQGRWVAAVHENPLGAWAGVGLWGALLGGLASVASGRVPAWRAIVTGYTVGGLAVFVWTFLEWWSRLALPSALR